MPVIARLRRTRAGKAGLIGGGLVVGLLGLELLGFLATVYYGPQLLRYAEAAGVAEMLPK